MILLVVITVLLFFLPSGIFLPSGKHKVHRTMSCHKLAILFDDYTGQLLSSVIHFPFRYRAFSTETDSKFSPCQIILHQTLRSWTALARRPEKVRTQARRSSSRLTLLGILMMCLLFFLLDTWFLSNVKLAARIATGNTTVHVFQGLSTCPPPPPLCSQ